MLFRRTGHRRLDRLGGVVNPLFDEDPVANDDHGRARPSGELASLQARAREGGRGGLHIVVWQVGDGNAADHLVEMI